MGQASPGQGRAGQGQARVDQGGPGWARLSSVLLYAQMSQLGSRRSVSMNSAGMAAMSRRTSEPRGLMDPAAFTASAFSCRWPWAGAPIRPAWLCRGRLLPCNREPSDWTSCQPVCHVHLWPPRDRTVLHRQSPAGRTQGTCPERWSILAAGLDHHINAELPHFGSSGTLLLSF